MLAEGGGRARIVHGRRGVGVQAWQGRAGGRSVALAVGRWQPGWRGDGFMGAWPGAAAGAMGNGALWPGRRRSKGVHRLQRPCSHGDRGRLARRRCGLGRRHAAVGAAGGAGAADKGGRRAAAAGVLVPHLLQLRLAGQHAVEARPAGRRGRAQVREHQARQARGYKDPASQQGEGPADVCVQLACTNLTTPAPPRT